MGQDISLKSERKNPWFKPWFNIFWTHNQLCMPQYGQCLEYLVYITLVKSRLLWKPIYVSTNFCFYWSQLWFTIRTIKEHFAVHLWDFSLGLNISCHIMQTVNKARNGFQKCSISFIKIENWGFTSVEWKFTDSFKGGLISESILTLVPFSKKGAKFIPWAENLNKLFSVEGQEIQTF